MPTYEYECRGCNYRFEVFQKMTAKPLKKCPRCKKTLDRLFGSGSGIIFKGAGFYATDYRNPAPAPAKDKCASCPHKDKEGNEQEK